MLEFTLMRSCRCARGLPSAAEFRRLAGWVLEREGFQGPAELTLNVVSARDIRSLNRTFRGVDRETDVISFRNDLDQSPAPGAARRSGPDGLQGDVAIDPRRAARQARRAGHALAREARLLWIHAVLHLLGYSDYSPGPRRKMFRRQNQLLIAWERRQSPHPKGLRPARPLPRGEGQG